MGESSIDPASPQINEHASLEHPDVGPKWNVRYA